MNLTRPEAVTIALYLLGGTDSPTDTEEVAVRAALLAPGMFSWKTYPDFIDKELVRVALSDARLKKEWVVGSHSKGGWLLTPAGVSFASSREEAIESVGVAPSSRDERQWARERARLQTSAAMVRIAHGDDPEQVTEAEADAFFRINSYVVGQSRERKIARIENQFGDDEELGVHVRFLATIARKGGIE